MVVALIVLTAAYLVIAGLIALNSVFETERHRLVAKDVLVIALVSVTWPAVGCVLLSALACRALCLRRRDFLSTAR